MALVEKEAAVMIADSQAVEKLGDTIEELIADNRRCEKMRANVKAMALTDSSRKIGDEIEKILEER